MYISILFPWIAPPLSSTVYSFPFIFNFVPKANCPEAATVCPATACVPEAVLPVTFPQHLAHEQYAVTLNIFVGPVAVLVLVVAVFVLVFVFAIVLPDLDVMFL